MIELINKLLARFDLKIVSTKPDTTLVEETVKFLDTIPKESMTNDGLLSPYVGDIRYIQERVKGEFPQVSGNTYIQENIIEDKYFYNYEGEKFTPEQLSEKLNND